MAIYIFYSKCPFDQLDYYFSLTMTAHILVAELGG